MTLEHWIFSTLCWACEGSGASWYKLRYRVSVVRHIPFIVFLHQKQYIFIHDTILEAIKVGNTQIEVMNLRKKLNELGALDPETDQSGIEAEFGVSIIVLTYSEIVAINL